MSYSFPGASVYKSRRHIGHFAWPGKISPGEHVRVCIELDKGSTTRTEWTVEVLGSVRSHP